MCQIGYSLEPHIARVGEKQVKYTVRFSLSTLPKLTQGDFIALLPVVYESSNLLNDLEAGKEHNRNLIMLMSV